MESKDLQSYSLEELTDKYIGEKGTPRREQFEPYQCKTGNHFESFQGLTETKDNPGTTLTIV